MLGMWSLREYVCENELGRPTQGPAEEDWLWNVDDGPKNRRRRKFMEHGRPTQGLVEVAD